MNKKTILILTGIILIAIIVLAFISLKSLGQLSKCGNGICDTKEKANLKLCPKDCKSTAIKTEICSNLGETVCSSNETCSGDWLNASDSDRCCNGKCQTKAQLTLKQIISEKAITLEDVKQQGRPEIIIIDNRIFFVFQKGNDFWLVELNEDLSHKSSVYKIYSGPNTLNPHDIRLATDGTKLWYAFETVDRGALKNTCKGHFLNIAKYNISGSEPILENFKLKIAKGCPFNTHKDLETPDYPELVDDPTPFFYNGEYIVLTRAWWNHYVSHIRTFDQDFNLLRDFTINLGPSTNNRQLSQNALVDINGQIFIIGGLATSYADSGIYAIPLSNDLTSVEGEIIPLVDKPGIKSTKTTAVRYVDRKLYINYMKKISENSFQHLGVFDVNTNFTLIDEIQFQNVPYKNNHASIGVLGNRVYVFYSEGELKLKPNILGQVFEWQER